MAIKITLTDTLRKLLVKENYHSAKHHCGCYGSRRVTVIKVFIHKDAAASLKWLLTI
jgi:hypothetical protein